MGNPCNPCNPRSKSFAACGQVGLLRCRGFFCSAFLCTAIGQIVRRRRRFNAEAQRFAEIRRDSPRGLFLCESPRSFASLRLNGPLERNRRSLKNFAPPLRTSDFGFRPSDFRLRRAAFLCVSALSPVWSWLRLGRAGPWLLICFIGFLQKLADPLVWDIVIS